MLEKKEKVLLKKASAEVEKAKEFTRAKNKRGMYNVTILLFTGQ
jgi:charged multivesicular body protein 4